MRSHPFMRAAAQLTDVVSQSGIGDGRPIKVLAGEVGVLSV